MLSCYIKWYKLPIKKVLQRDKNYVKIEKELQRKKK